MQLKCQKHLFSLREDETYLNGAYMSPLLKSAEKAGIDALLLKKVPTDLTLDHFFDVPEQLKALFAQLINVDEPERVAIIPAASYGIATVVKNVNLKRGETILIVGDQFPSNYYAWKRLTDEKEGNIKIISAPVSLDNRGKTWNENILNSITSDVKVVTMCHVHWADGTLFDLVTIRRKCDEVGALLIIDGTQSVGALPFDQSEIKADALICAGYKWLCGPYALGVAFFGDKFDNGEPIEESWINRLDSRDFKNLVNYQDLYREGANRYCMGESSNFSLVPVLIEGIKQLVTWDPEQYQAYSKYLVDSVLDQLTSQGYWIEREKYRSNHLLGICVVNGRNVEDIKNGLIKEKVSVSYRGNFIRVSPGIYNTKLEMRKFANCLSIT